MVAAESAAAVIAERPLDPAAAAVIRVFKLIRTVPVAAVLSNLAGRVATPTMLLVSLKVFAMTIATKLRQGAGVGAGSAV